MSDTPETSPPGQSPQREIRAAWLGFVRSTALLLVAVPDDRPLDQFLPFRDKVLAMVQDETFLSALDEAWALKTDHHEMDVGEALLLELRAFPLAVEVANTTASTPAEKVGWINKLLGRASTAAESVKDILDKLPGWARMTIVAFKELVDMFGRRA